MFNKEKLIKLMEEKNLKLIDVSKLCGIAYSTLRDLYTGKNKNPLANTLKKMAEGLGVDSDYFIDLDSIKTEVDITMNRIIEALKTATPEMKERTLKMIEIFREEQK